MKTRRESKSTFAQNLRREVSRFTSIAEVCRGVGVNRQQFNKYLSGAHLPSAKTRRRICRFLRVPEEVLFQRPAGTSSKSEKVKARRLGFWSADKLAVINQALRTVFPQQSVGAQGLPSDGYYFCYFPMQDRKEMLVRSIVKISTSGGLTTFVRHTYFMTPEFGVGFVAQGRHRGVILSWQNEFYLLSVNSAEPLHPSLIVFPSNAKLESEEFSEKTMIFRGLGLTRGLSEPYLCRVCLEFIGRNLKASRPKLQTAGIVRHSDKSIHPFVRASLSPNAGETPSQLGLPTIESILATQAIRTKRS